MYLLDTDVVSELRKQNKANQGVAAFFRRVVADDAPVYLSVITIGELRRGIELIRHRGDHAQADALEGWLFVILKGYTDQMLALEEDVAQVWGRLRVPHHENAIDKQIAATALVYDLTLVTRNARHFEQIPGLRLLNPFS